MKLDNTLAFMFETRFVLEPTAFALASPALQADYDAGLVRVRQAEDRKMKLASLKGPTRDGTLLIVNSGLSRAVTAEGIAPTMQHLLENWDALYLRMIDAAESLECGGERHAFDFQAALAKGEVAAPLPRAFQWLDGSAYLSHVERVRRARNDTVPESFYKDPLMYQGGADAMMGPRDPIRALSEDWGIDLEGEVAAITADVAMGATPRKPRPRCACSRW